MPTSLAAVVVSVVAVLPGLLGDKVFQLLVGSNWREKEWRVVLRLLAFSVAGATLYSLFSLTLAWPSVIHLIPRTYERIGAGLIGVNVLFLPYVGHVVGGALAGFLAAIAVRGLAKISPRSPYPSAWDDFVRTYSVERWVIIGLQTGDVYAGRLATVDLSVPAADREIVLAEPCAFESGQYRALSYQYMFFRAESIYSIAIVYDKTRDIRLVDVDEALFEEEHKNGERKEHAAATATKMEARKGDQGGLATSTPEG